VNVSDEFVKLNSKVGNDVRILEKFSKNSDQNILKLNEQREHLYQKLKTNREKINRALDAFEVVTKRKLQSNFDKELEVIMKQQNRLSSKISDLKSCKHQIESILDVEVKSNIHFFLFQNKAKEQMKQNEADIDNMLGSLLDISSACVLSTEVDHESQTVKMLQTLEFERRICSNDLELEHESDDENETTASSTVEADDILKTGDLNPKERNATAPTCVKLFRFKHNFTLDPPDFNSENSNRIIKVVSNNRIMITGKYNKKLLFFSKSGEKHGEIQIDYPATAVAVINDEILAVAASRAVVFVDTKRFNHIDLIPLEDNCVGIAYVKKQLLVNCKTRGIIVMDGYGNIMQILKTFTGRLQLCTVNNDTIALVYPHSNTIHYLNKTSQKSSYFQIPGRIGAKCVTSDRNGNMFITCQDEIFIACPPANEYHSILGKTDEIKNPFGIDIDIKSHELFVLNNGGMSIYVFQK
jgi:Holliday junction resolvase RusA-like endonuclease